jgi:hypothetical protein
MTTIKPTTRHYWKQVFTSLLKSWPGLAEREVHRTARHANSVSHASRTMIFGICSPPSESKPESTSQPSPAGSVHKDGGALAMKTYGHLRREHSVAQALKVSFAPVATKQAEVIPFPATA